MGMQARFCLPYQTNLNRAQDVLVDRGQHLMQLSVMVTCEQVDSASSSTHLQSIVGDGASGEPGKYILDTPGVTVCDTPSVL
jgi:hypothetical protein